MVTAFIYTPDLLEQARLTRDHLRSLIDLHYDGPGRIVLYGADINALEARLLHLEVAIGKAEAKEAR